MFAPRLTLSYCALSAFSDQGVSLCQKDNFGSHRLKNHFDGPEQVCFAPLGALGPILTLKSCFWVKIGNFGFWGLSGTQNFK